MAQIDASRLYTLVEGLAALLGYKLVPIQPPTVAAPGARRPIAWGARVSQVFRDRIWWIADTLKLNPDDLMSCIAWETGRKFSADVKNMAGSGATGLIQFMPATAKSLGTTTAALARMTAEDQLNYVFKYFRDYGPSDRYPDGRLKTLADIYMAILWPKGVGQPEDYVLFDGRPASTWKTAYRQNAGFDVNKDLVVTKAEASAKLRAMKAEGLRPENMA